MTEAIEELEVRTLGFAPELDRAYRLYATKTIEDRALPDVRDGCKPVQRRILYAMHDMGLRADRPHKKCARIVGEVLGKYHPHGDQSVYGSLARLAQPFAMREPLIDGQGNFGSLDGDSPAAMRYTEARLSPLGELLLADIDAQTVPFIDNFDGSLQEPVVLPAMVPNLLVNGASGIAVGMATNIPPHNLGEVVDAIEFMLSRWRTRGSITVAELMEIIPGPDFPTGGVIYRYREQGGEVVDTIARAYERGRARIVVQARVHVEPIAGGKSNIVITELPYSVQKNTVIERIAREVKDGRITGVTDLRDESDYDTGMRVVVEVSRAASADDVMVDLLKYSQLQETFGCNTLALVPDGPGDGVRPQHLSLKDLLEEFISFRLQVVERRTRYELDSRRARLHIVAGLLIAVNNIDEVVRMIRAAESPDAAREALCARFKLSEVQATAILDMPLRRLTTLETTKLEEEERELVARINYLEGLLESEDARLQVVAQESRDLKERYATPRRSVILDTEGAAVVKAVTEADLRTPEAAQVVIVTQASIERKDAAGYRYARTEGLTTRATTSHLLELRVEPADELLLVSSQGRAWRNAVGFIGEKALFEQIGLRRGERVVGAGVLTGAGAQTLVLGTRAGRVKRTHLQDLAMHPGNWSVVIGLADEADEVVFAGIAGDDADVLFATEKGLVLRTTAAEVNPQASGSARGVAGIGVRADDKVIAGGLVRAADADGWAVYIVTEEGFAKRVAMSEYPAKGRGSQGVQTVRLNRTTGNVAAVALGRADAPLDVLFGDGKRFHLPAAQVPVDNRYNLGKRVVPVWDAEGPVIAAAAL